jgi:dTDP-4-amino-4,6-dideoxygalactose transaminase
MNAFDREPSELRAQELEAVERVLRSGWYILGNEVKTFEAAWAKYCDAGACVGLGNGLDALEIGLRALGIGAGDEVITTPMTAFATVLGILRAGATPVLADIDPDTGLLAPDSVERCISDRTRAVLLVHLYGRVGDMEMWTTLCASRGIALLEDCAQSHGARWNGRPAGTWGRWGAYSFYPTKNLGTPGDGGALIASESTLADKARVLGNYGQSQRYHHPVIGMNSRLDELHAALLKVRLAWLPEFTSRRRRIARQYSASIRNPAVRLLAAPPSEENHVHHLYVVCSPDRDRLSRHLRDCGVETLIHYPLPVHHQEPCRTLRRDPRGLDNADRHGRECLSLPCNPYLIESEVAAVADGVNTFR